MPDKGGPNFATIVIRTQIAKAMRPAKFILTCGTPLENVAFTSASLLEMTRD